MVSEIAVIFFFISMILETAYVFSQITNEEPVWKWAEDVAVLFLMILLVSGFLIQENKKEWLIIGFYLLGFLAMIYAIWGLYRQKKKRSQILNENSISFRVVFVFRMKTGGFFCVICKCMNFVRWQQVIIFSILAFS